MADSIDDKLETENGINLDNPIVRLFRRKQLEAAATEQGSDLYCPECEVNLPITPMTVNKEQDGTDANMNPSYKTSYYCTICEKHFYEKDRRQNGTQ